MYSYELLRKSCLIFISSYFVCSIPDLIQQIFFSFTTFLLYYCKSIPQPPTKPAPPPLLLNSFYLPANRPCLHSRIIISFLTVHLNVPFFLLLLIPCYSQMGPGENRVLHPYPAVPWSTRLTLFLCYLSHTTKML